MNTIPVIGSARRTKGVALVTVLALLVLITALIVGFLARVGTEGVASSNYAGTATTRFLADTAINVVQAQINEATMLPGTNAWASQPGAIRVFDDNGALTKIYKLYSAATLAPDATNGNVLASDVPPVTWADSPALWTDLNAPVKVAGMTDPTDPSAAEEPDYLVFPVLDPRDPADTTSTWNKPGVTSKLPGFSITGAPGITEQQPAPMPVRWLYVLEDGRIVAPTGAGKTATIPGATKLNPIVGRIAFWTDDEASKVNINTAAGSLSTRNGNLLPASWDVPRYKMWEELRVFSQNQPTHGEYQRYPGHPASTDLFNIFKALALSFDASATSPQYPPAMETTPINANADDGGKESDFFRLLPRYNDKSSSRGGSANTTRSYSLMDPVPAKTERLFSSLGELLFNPGRTPNKVQRQQLESGKFFLTASSRAPEVTLFGTPRIAMWPIDSAYGSDPTPGNTTKLASTYDRLIAFCATTGFQNRNPYYFQRHDSTSPSSDFLGITRNVNLYSYLKRLTSLKIPGFGGKFGDKYSFKRPSDNSTERDQILTEMVDYIRSTNTYDHSTIDSNPNNPHPRFTPKYASNGASQVVPLAIDDTSGLGRMYTISEMGVHIIATADAGALPYQAPVDVAGKSHPVSPVHGSANDPGYVSNLTEEQYLRDTTGAIVGLASWAPSGEVQSGSKIRRHVLLSNEPGAAPFPANPTLADSYTGAKVRLNSGERRLQAVLLFELSCPMAGFDFMTPDINIEVSNLHELQLGVQTNGQTPFADKNGLVETFGPNRLDIVQNTGGINGFQMFLSKRAWSGSNVRYNGWSQPFSGATSPYIFVSKPFTVSSSESLWISGNFKVEIKVKPKGGGPPSIVAQTFDVSFPFVYTPMPDLLKSGIKTVAGSTTKVSTAADLWGFDNRFRWLTSSPVSTHSSGNAAVRPAFGWGAFIFADPTSTSNPWQYDRSATTRIPYSKNTDGSDGVSGPSDVVRTLIAPGGDTRLVMAKRVVNANGLDDMTKHPGYNTSKKLVNSFQIAGKGNVVAGSDLSGKLVPGADYLSMVVPKVDSSLTPRPYWDWDTGLPSMLDGAYANKPDEGNLYVNGGASPYYNAEQAGDADYFPSYFTANRIIPSAVMFGSLPTGVKQNIPWRTLRFRPVYPGSLPATYNPPGPPDHLMLDLFNMPVVEPYAISEPFSTAGKINMNYQIVPFTYIHRSTGVRAVLGSEMVARVPLRSERSRDGNNNNGNIDGTYYKGTPGTSPTPVVPSGATASITRLPLDLDENTGTLSQFEAKFNSWDIFKSASEICDLYLVPEDPSDPGRYTWPTFGSSNPTGWYGNDFAMVGDNVRERPYAHLYPRLTTKSNTFTVHYRVQSLKNPSAIPADWIEGRGVITGEYRGSTTIERFLDPNNDAIPDYATTPSAPSLDTFYQWRVVANNAFAP